MAHKHTDLPELLADFNDQSKVWIYTSSRVLQGAEADAANKYMSDFAQQWVSHNRQLKAFGGLVDDRFAVLVVDETQAGASGCSIDASVRFLKQLGDALKVDFFDRMIFSYVEGGRVHTVSRNIFEGLVESGDIGPETMVVDTLVSTKSALISTMIKPLQNSWHARLVSGIV